MKNITLDKPGEAITIHTPAGKVLVRVRGLTETVVQVCKPLGGQFGGADYFIETKHNTQLPAEQIIPVVVKPLFPSTFDFAEKVKVLAIRRTDTVTMEEIGKEGTALWHKIVEHQKQKK